MISWPRKIDSISALARSLTSSPAYSSSKNVAMSAAVVTKRRPTCVSSSPIRAGAPATWPAPNSSRSASAEGLSENWIIRTMAWKRLSSSGVSSRSDGGSSIVWRSSSTISSAKSNSPNRFCSYASAITISL